MKARFEEAHLRRYGFVMPEKALVIEAASVEAVGAVEERRIRSRPAPAGAERDRSRWRRLPSTPEARSARRRYSGARRSARATR